MHFALLAYTEGPKMKRIIDGKTYNTNSATIVAEGNWKDENQDLTIATTLYQNRAGIYFGVEQHQQEWRDRDGETRVRTWQEWIILMEEGAAAKYCDNNGLTIYRGFDAAAPEAGDTSETDTIYVRVPRGLKLAVEAKAQAEEVSINAFAMRCLERCIRPASVT